MSEPQPSGKGHGVDAEIQAKMDGMSLAGDPHHQGTSALQIMPDWKRFCGSEWRTDLQDADKTQLCRFKKGCRFFWTGQTAEDLQFWDCR